MGASVEYFRYAVRMKYFQILAILLLTLPTSVKAQACFETSITSPSPFLGNHGEIFRTADGGIYEVSGSYEYMYAYFPQVTICPARGRMLVQGKVVQVQALQTARGGGRSSSPNATVAPIAIVLRIRRCDYFIADGPQGFYLLEWYGGYDPKENDGILGELSTFGFKDVIYANGLEGRLYVDDYLLSRSRAFEKLSQKCR